MRSIIQISINGYYYEEKSLKQLLEKSQLLDNNEIKSQILFYLYYYTKDDEKENYAKILEKYYSENEALKKSFIYIGFMNLRGVYFVNKQPPTVKSYSDINSNEVAILRVTPAAIEYLLIQNGLNPIPAVKEGNI